MNFRQLEVFRAVMVSGTTSRAAELLHVSQPAISRSVAELEQSVGFSLFDRVRGRLVPTPEAKLLMKEVDRSFVGLDRLRAEVARIRDFGSGTIKVASQAALADTLVPRAIRAFLSRHPDIALTLQVMSSSTVREMVADGGFDVGLAADEVDLSGVDHRMFGSFRAVCALPPHHPLCRKRTITPADLAGERFIALSPGDRARERLDVVLQAAGVETRIVIETPNSITVCALALEGIGIGLTNPMAVDGFARRGVVFRPFEPAIHFKSVLLFRPDAQKSRLVKAFVAELMNARSYRALGINAETRLDR